SESPAQTDTIAMPADSHIARYGRAVSRWAAPAGPAIRPSSRSAPTAWLAAAAVTPNSPKNAKPRKVTGAPRARATAPSRLANSSGRALTMTATVTARQISASIVAWEADSPKIVPNSTFTPDVPFTPLDDVV